MGQPFINDKGENARVRELMKPDTVNNKIIGKDPLAGFKPGLKEVNLAVRGNGSTDKK